MFKKTIAALAVAGAFGTMAAGAVYAADVTLYGVVDLGLKLFSRRRRPERRRCR